MIKYVVLSFVFLTMACSFQEKEGVVSFDPDKSVAENISENVIVQHDTTNFSFLRDILRDKRIVIIGESSHFEGTGSKVRKNIVSYLINHLEFNTLACEGFDMLNFSLRQLTGNPVDISVFNTDKKIDFFGFDAYVNDSYMADLKKFIRKYDPEYYDQIAWPTVEFFAKEYYSVYDNGRKLEIDEKKQLCHIKNADISYYVEFLNMLRIQTELWIKKNPKEKSLRQFRQCVINLKYQYIQAVSIKNSPVNITMRLRDRKMADNIIWYMNENPDAKMIICCHNVHASKFNNEFFLFNDLKEEMTAFQMMGEFLSEEFGESLYSLACTSYETTGFDFRNKSVTKESLEAQLNKKGIKYGFVDFQSLRYDPRFQNKSFRASFNVAEGEARWLNMFDGVFFLRKNDVSRNMLTLEKEGAFK